MSGAAWTDNMEKGDRYANRYNAGGTRCTPDQVIRKVGWQEHNASSSSSNWNQADKGWKPSLRSTGYNWEPSASGSASWKDSPYNRELLASGGTGVIDYGDYSYDQSAWYDGGGYGTEADNSWCQEGEPDLHWPEAPPKPCADSPLAERTVISRAKTSGSSTRGGSEPVDKKAKNMVWRAISSTKKMAAKITEMHVREPSEPRPDAGQNFVGISYTRFAGDGVQVVELDERQIRPTTQMMIVSLRTSLTNLGSF